MSSNHFDETEESLKRLGQRRMILEKKTALRLATMDEFRVVKAESLARLENSIASQNIAAKERNMKLLNDINSFSLNAVNNSGNISRTLFGIDHSQNSQIKDKLAEAKKNYHNKIEIMMPVYRQKNLQLYESELIRMKAEKRSVEERRLKLQQGLQNEEIIKGYLEQERRSLALSLGELSFFSIALCFIALHCIKLNCIHCILLCSGIPCYFVLYSATLHVLCCIILQWLAYKCIQCNTMQCNEAQYNRKEHNKI